MFKLIAALVTIALLGPIYAQIDVTSTTPTANETSAPRNGNVEVNFNNSVATTSSSNFKLYSRKRGWISGSYSTAGSNVTFDPARAFAAGERIECVVNGNTQTISNQPISEPFAWQFHADVDARQANFSSNSYALFPQSTTPDEYHLTTLDLNGDGWLDIVVTHYNAQSVIYFNDGTGDFPSSLAKNFGSASVNSYAIDGGDFDGDGDIDLVHTVAAGQNLVYWNDGSGNFPSSTQIGTGTDQTIDLAVGDIDSDGDLDIVFANGGIGNEVNTIHLNDGAGNFTTAYIEYMIGSGANVADNSWDVELADMNGDGHLDIITAFFSLSRVDPSRVYFNDGQGRFEYMNSSAFAPAEQAMCVAVGDVDGDGDNDIVMGTNGSPTSVSSQYGPSYVCKNDGAGNFTSNWLNFNREKTWAVDLVDLDGDNDLDLVFPTDNSYSYVMLNDGTGLFSPSRLSGVTYAQDCDYGDLDNDGDVDVVMQGTVFYNGGRPADINVRFGGNWLTDGDTVNLPYNATLASQSPFINISDFDYDLLDVSVQITNQSTQGFNLSEWEASQAQSPLNLQPSTGTFNVGTVTHHVTISADDGTTITTFKFDIVVGVAMQPGIEVSDSGGSISAGAGASGDRDFGSMDINAGATASATIEITNSGNANLDLTSISLAGADAGEFLLTTGSLASTVTPGSTTSFTIAFDPSSAGAKSAQLEIVHNDPNAPSPFSFEVIGTGLAAPAMVVKLGGATLNDGGAIAFGTHEEGTTATPRTITIENNGSADLTLGTPTLGGANAGAFSLDLSSFSNTVTPGASTSFTLRFDASAVGSYSATLGFTHNDPQVTSPFDLNVSGSVHAPVDTGNGGGGADSGSGGCVAHGGLDYRLLLLLMVAAGGMLLLRRQQA